ncbi:MAG: DUF4957 domain-containing protein [Arcticibacter sp.]
MKLKNILNGLFFTMLCIAVASCKKDEFDPSVNLSRQFLPTTLKVTAGETQVQISWSKALFTTSKDSVTYTVLVSTDSTFASTSQMLTKVTDTASITLTDDDLAVKQKYYALVKTNGAGTTADSKWGRTPAFSITGEQIFSPVLPSEIKDKSVTLRWRNTANLTKISLKATSGAAIEIPLTANDVADNFKLITGLTPLTSYVAEIYQGAKLKGTTTFVTPEPSIFTVILEPGDDLIVAVNNAANGDVIGLKPGTYNVAENLVFAQKSVTLQSVSGNPGDTKVNFKEVVLAGTGAGAVLKGIEFDGAAYSAAYFINLVGGVGNDAGAATFSSILVDNCNIHNLANCIMRANRAANGDHKINSIKFTNSKAYDISSGATYVTFTIEKLEFKTMELSNSTFYNIGRTFISAGTTLPSSAAKPSVLIDNCTFNNFGSGGNNRNYLIIDANANPIDFVLRNSILANSPMTGGAIGNAALRAAAPTSMVSVTNNNIFKLTNGASPAADLTFPNYATPANLKTIDLGWNAATTDFSLPAGSELRTSGTNGGPIGDPRWAK